MSFRLFWALWMLTLLSACATIDPPLNPRIYYKHDMVITVNGYARQGVLVAPRAPLYKITITSQEDMDLLQISTCARDLDLPPGIKSGWFGKREYTFTYEPNKVEKDKGCNIIKLAGYNKADGKHSWAFIVLEDPSFQLPAGVACNNDPDYRSNGVTACQTLQHLIAQIWFESKVILSAKVLDRCKIPDAKDGIHWEFAVPNRECTYEFMEAKPPYRRHQLITVGYEDVPIRVE